MAIIAPSRTFEGSEIDSDSSYILPDKRQIRFYGKDKPNKEGIWLYFLPAYKIDASGAGVWYRKIFIRDNFGDKYKDRYVVNDTSKDPAHYFENKLKLHFPDMARVLETETIKGKRKVYPHCGRLTTRVLFNVAMVSQLQAGAYVLDLPVYNGADQIEKWHKNKLPDGSPCPLICNPTACCPVFIKLNDGAGSQPWQIQVSNAQLGVLPEQLADQAYIYNLDLVTVERSPEEIISKLRDLYQPHIVNKCLEGYAGFVPSVVVSMDYAQATPVNPAFVQQAPAGYNPMTVAPAGYNPMATPPQMVQPTMQPPQMVQPAAPVAAPVMQVAPVNNAPQQVMHVAPASMAPPQMMVAPVNNAPQQPTTPAFTTSNPMATGADEATVLAFLSAGQAQ